METFQSVVQAHPNLLSIANADALLACWVVRLSAALAQIWPAKCSAGELDHERDAMLHLVGRIEKKQLM